MQQAIQTNGDQRQPGEKKSQRRPRWLRIAIWVIGWIAFLGLVVVGLVVASRYLIAASDPVQFVTGNLLNALIFIAIVVQAYIYREQWKVMDKSLVVGTRAYVGIYSIDSVIGKTPNALRAVTINLENIGKIPAEKIKVFMEATMRTHLTEAEIEAGDVRLFPTESWAYDFGASKLFPGSLKMELVTPLILYFSDAELALAWRRHALFTLLVRIDYETGLGTADSSEMFFHFRRPNQWVPTMIRTPEEMERDTSEYQEPKGTNPN